MRIRKDRKPYYVTLCTLSSSTADLPSHESYVPTLPQTLVCLTNRARWDVLGMSPQSPPPSPTPRERDVWVEREKTQGTEDRSSGGERLIRSVRRNSRSPWLETIEEVEEETMKKRKKKGKRSKRGCREEVPSKRAGKGRKYVDTAIKPEISPQNELFVSADKIRSSTGRDKRPSSSSQGPDYYYYSGFGPRWDSKRMRVGIQIKDDLGNGGQSDVPSDTDEDEDEEVKVVYQKKTSRKPIKARSLKSL